MRGYKKKDAPEVLRKWTGSNHPWFDFVSDKTAYPQVKKSLLEEQNHLCCYCESAVKDAYRHIEHYEPRSRAQNSIYEYTSMACSCNRGRHLIQREPDFGVTSVNYSFNELLGKASSPS